MAHSSLLVVTSAIWAPVIIFPPIRWRLFHDLRRSIPLHQSGALTFWIWGGLAHRHTLWLVANAQRCKILPTPSFFKGEGEWVMQCMREPMGSLALGTGEAYSTGVTLCSAHWANRAGSQEDQGLKAEFMFYPAFITSFKCRSCWKGVVQNGNSPPRHKGHRRIAKAN